MNSYALFILCAVGMVLAALAWWAISLIAALRHELTSAIRTLQHTEKDRRAEDQRQVNALASRLERIEGYADYSSNQLHALAAHFVPRLKTSQDVREEQSYLDDIANGEDPASAFQSELARRNERGNEVPSGWKDITHPSTSSE